MRGGFELKHRLKYSHSLEAVTDIDYNSENCYTSNEYPIFNTDITVLVDSEILYINPF